MYDNNGMPMHPSLAYANNMGASFGHNSTSSHNIDYGAAAAGEGGAEAGRTMSMGQSSTASKRLVRKAKVKQADGTYKIVTLGADGKPIKDGATRSQSPAGAASASPAGAASLLTTPTISRAVSMSKIIPPSPSVASAGVVNSNNNTTQMVHPSQAGTGWRERFTRFYQFHAPDKMDKVETCMTMEAGPEAVMEALENKYGPEPLVSVPVGTILANSNNNNNAMMGMSGSVSQMASRSPSVSIGKKIVKKVRRVPSKGPPASRASGGGGGVGSDEYPPMESLESVLGASNGGSPNPASSVNARSAAATPVNIVTPQPQPPVAAAATATKKSPSPKKAAKKKKADEASPAAKKPQGAASKALGDLLKNLRTTKSDSDSDSDTAGDDEEEDDDDEEEAAPPTAPPVKAAPSLTPTAVAAPPPAATSGSSGSNPAPSSTIGAPSNMLNQTAVFSGNSRLPPHASSGTALTATPKAHDHDDDEDESEDVIRGHDAAMAILQQNKQTASNNKVTAAGNNDDRSASVTSDNTNSNDAQRANRSQTPPSVVSITAAGSPLNLNAAAAEAEPPSVTASAAGESRGKPEETTTFPGRNLNASSSSSAAAAASPSPLVSKTDTNLNAAAERDAHHDDDSDNYRQRTDTQPPSFVEINNNHSNNDQTTTGKDRLSSLAPPPKKTADNTSTQRAALANTPTNARRSSSASNRPSDNAANTITNNNNSTNNRHLGASTASSEDDVMQRGSGSISGYGKPSFTPTTTAQQAPASSVGGRSSSVLRNTNSRYRSPTPTRIRELAGNNSSNNNGNSSSNSAFHQDPTPWPLKPYHGAASPNRSNSNNGRPLSTTRAAHASANAHTNGAYRNPSVDRMRRNNNAKPSSSSRDVTPIATRSSALRAASSRRGSFNGISAIVAPGAPPITVIDRSTFTPNITKPPPLKEVFGKKKSEIKCYVRIGPPSPHKRRQPDATSDDDDEDNSNNDDDDNHHNDGGRHQDEGYYNHDNRSSMMNHNNTTATNNSGTSRYGTPSNSSSRQQSPRRMAHMAEARAHRLSAANNALKGDTYKKMGADEIKEVAHAFNRTPRNSKFSYFDGISADYFSTFPSRNSPQSQRPSPWARAPVGQGNGAIIAQIQKTLYRAKEEEERAAIASSPERGGGSGGDHHENMYANSTSSSPQHYRNNYRDPTNHPSMNHHSCAIDPDVLTINDLIGGSKKIIRTSRGLSVEPADDSEGGGVDLSSYGRSGGGGGGGGGKKTVVGIDGMDGVDELVFKKCIGFTSPSRGGGGGDTASSRGAVARQAQTILRADRGVVCVLRDVPRDPELVKRQKDLSNRLSKPKSLFVSRDVMIHKK